MAKQGRSIRLSPEQRDLLLLFLLSLLFINPLFTKDWIMTGESLEQIFRLIELDRGIGDGSFYPRWCGDLAGGFGSPYFIFYAPLIYYVAEAFHLLGLGWVTSMKCMIFVGVFLSGWGMYLMARPFWGRYGAMVAGVAYMYVPYRMVNLYIRGDFAEAFAMSLLPFVLYFFYQTVMDGRLRWLFGAAISYGALIFTHNCTTFIFSGFLVVFLSFTVLQGRSVQGLSRGLAGMLWALGLSAIFWLPALVEKDMVNIHLIYSDLALDFRNNFLELKRLFSTVWTLEEGPGGRDLPLQIGWSHILLALLSCFYLLQADDRGPGGGREWGHLLAFFTLLAVYFTNASSRPLWEILPLVKYLQFPWRFLSVLSLFVALLCGGLLLYFKGVSRGVQQALKIVLLIIIVQSGSAHCRVKGYYVISEANLTSEWVRAYGGTISAYNTDTMDQVRDYGEYMPKWVKRLPDKALAGQVQVLAGKGRITDLKRTLQSYEFTISAEEKVEILVGSFYYPTWKGRIEGKEVSLFSDDEGLIHLQVPGGINRVKVSFGESPTRKWARYLFLFSLLAVLAVFSFGVGKKRVSMSTRGRLKRESVEEETN